MKALEKLKQRLIGYVHIQSGLWLRNKGLVITSESSSTPAQRNALPNVERTPVKKILDQIHYKIDRRLACKPMPELRVRESYDKISGTVYSKSFYWWYPTDWDFEIGGKEN